ncbi:Hypothetical protein, putative [Bodo saltans]|uniref:BSD domain-containing protein n=1 Tax=Bodo saltans TaxID=75058 RepID=A0A0S4JIQ1_BODSA|nr:Hypothetical protein, putative [Bodo saltans]|eukprot:CUG91335.1 Hypothetical protein, putative [Bodo saltans]
MSEARETSASPQAPQQVQQTSPQAAAKTPNGKSTAAASSPQQQSSPLPPAEVALISNPIPSFSVFQWVPRGVRNLNRRNKLSSLPFWFPNDTMRLHQFRLVLLRGVVKEDREEDDAVAVFLEYIPPPPTPSTTSSTTHPKGCRVTMRLLNRAFMDEGSRAGDVIAESTATLDEVERQVAFREFMLPKHLADVQFVGDDGATVILEVSVMTGVNVVAESVAKSAGSLWSTFSSISSSVTTFVKDAVQSTRLDQREEFDDQSSNGGSGLDALNAAKQSATSFFSSLLDSTVGGSSAGGAAASSSSSGAPPQRELPWDTVPERWHGREEQWRNLLSVQLVEDENTFLVGVSRGIQPDEQLLLTQYGLNHRAITAAASLFDYDRDVHQGLLSLAALRAQRYRLVPQKINDEMFWATFMWKIASLSTCGTHDQAQLLLSIISAPLVVPPHRPAGDAGSGSGADGGDAASTLTATAGAFSSWVQTAARGITSTVRSTGGIMKGHTPPTDEEVTIAVKEAIESSAALEDYLDDGDDDTTHHGEDSGEDEEGGGGGGGVLMISAVKHCDSQLENLRKLKQRQVPESLEASVDAAVSALESVLRRRDEQKANKSVAAPALHAQPHAPLHAQPDEPLLVDALETEHAAQGEPTAEVQRDEAPASDEVTSQFDADDGTVEVKTNDAAQPLQPAGEAEEEEATTAPPAATNATDGSPLFDASFERLPSIDDIATPAAQVVAAGDSAQQRKGPTSSGKKLEFAPMPWEEDDD